jgi:hypothetical protein
MCEISPNPVTLFAVFNPFPFCLENSSVDNAAYQTADQLQTIPQKTVKDHFCHCATLKKEVAAT